MTMITRTALIAAGLALALTGCDGSSSTATTASDPGAPQSTSQANAAGASPTDAAPTLPLSEQHGGGPEPTLPLSEQHGGGPEPTLPLSEQHGGGPEPTLPLSEQHGGGPTTREPEARPTTPAAPTRTRRAPTAAQVREASLTAVELIHAAYNSQQSKVCPLLSPAAIERLGGSCSAASAAATRRIKSITAEVDQLSGFQIIPGSEIVTGDRARIPARKIFYRYRTDGPSGIHYPPTDMTLVWDGDSWRVDTF